MSINLAKFGKIGIILFVIIAFVFECLFGIIGYYYAVVYFIMGVEMI